MPDDPAAGGVAPAAACPRCAGVLREGARFCGHCGAPLGAYPAPPKPRRPRPAAPDPTIKRTLVFFVLFCVSNVLAFWIAKVDEGAALAAMFAVQAFDAAITAVWIGRFRPDVLGLLRRVRGTAVALAAALLAAWPFACLLHLFVTALQRMGMPEHRYSDDYLQAGYGWGVVVLSVVVQPAVVEELAFRGVIQSSLERVVRPGEAIFITALGFAIVHFSPVMLFPLLVMGLYFGLLRRWTGSLWPPMFAHALHNALVLADEAWDIFPL